VLADLHGEEKIHVSAVKGDGLGDLLAAIDRRLEDDPVRRMSLRIPQSEGKALALLEAKAKILSRTYGDGVVNVVVKAAESVLRGVQKWERE
jgi:50S ribosomal subunit-associated GTPase HflX